MSAPDSASSKVETTSRLAQWTIYETASWFNPRKSEAFRMGEWNWQLRLEKNRGCLAVKLLLEASNEARENPPIATFVMRVAAQRHTLCHPEVKEKQIKINEEFVWIIDSSLSGKLVIDLEFIDLKTASPDGASITSIWKDSLFSRFQSDVAALTSLEKLSLDLIFNDIVIHTSDGGSMWAHRAILASRSPVFRSMFSHDLIEKNLSTVTIPDISHEVCQAFVSYIYGHITSNDFLTHRLALVAVAHKYDVSDLREACHLSLLEDINTENVLDRLEGSHLYGLDTLKHECITYLVKFGKICEIKDEFDVFLQTADRELVSEVFQRILFPWNDL